MHFDYFATVKKQESIDIEDIGNCALEVYNDLGFEWLLIIKTHDGMTEAIEYGPLIPDIERPPANVGYSYSRFEFKEGKIYKKIDKFLNEGGKGITQAFITDWRAAADKMRNLVEFLYVGE